MKSNFDYSLQEETIIDSPINKVFSALHKFQNWPKYLPHVEKVEEIYDDGTYQEFCMFINTDDSELLKVRSVRKCDNQHIHFFQPEPPNFLRFHEGGWRLSIDGRKCKVKTYHNWSIDEISASKKFASDAEKKVENFLREHAKFALKMWKEILERA